MLMRSDIFLIILLLYVSEFFHINLFLYEYPIISLLVFFVNYQFKEMIKLDVFW